MNKSHKRHILKRLDGREIWTDAFNDRFNSMERLLIAVYRGKIYHLRNSYKATNKELSHLWGDYLINNGA